MSDLIYFGLIDHYSPESSFWGVIPGIKVPGMAGNELSSFGRFNTEPGSTSSSVSSFSFFLTRSSLLLKNFSAFQLSISYIVPEKPFSYQGKQVIINTDRVVLQSKKDSVLVFANDSISFSCNKSIHFDTGDEGYFIINTPKITKIIPKHILKFISSLNMK